MRIDDIKEIAAKAIETDSPGQRQLTDQLARQLQIEPDPLVRRALIEAIADFSTPLAQQVLEAGLNDDDAAVRVASCRAVGLRGEVGSIDALTRALRDDREIDVRLAAAEALGNIRSPRAVQALVIALDDRDPAMQYVGVQSMKAITGADLGDDVRAWRQLADGNTPLPREEPSIAERLRGMSPF